MKERCKKIKTKIENPHARQRSSSGTGGRFAVVYVVDCRASSHMITVEETGKERGKRFTFVVGRGEVVSSVPKNVWVSVFILHFYGEFFRFQKRKKKENRNVALERTSLSSLRASGLTSIFVREQYRWVDS